MATKSSSDNTSPNTRRGADEFKKAAKAYGLKSTKTKATASSTLERVGTHTSKGNLRKQYK